jgi:hypothetical protein
VISTESIVGIHDATIRSGVTRDANRAQPQYVDELLIP